MFQPTNIEIPEDLLAGMIGECQVWRGLVANPDLTWEQLKPLVEAGGIALGEAAGRIKQVYFLDEVIEGCDEPPARPRAVMRQTEEETVTRNGGFTLTGSVDIEFQFPVAEGFLGIPGAAVLDARKKLFALRTELISLGLQAGRLRILTLAQGAAMFNNPADDGSDEFERYLHGMFRVTYDGGGC